MTRIALVIVALYGCFVLGSGIAMQGIAQPPQQASAGATAVILLIVCFLQAIGVAFLVVRSRWSGWHLVAAIFVVFHGVTTFMPQIESAVFLTHLPQGMVPRLFLMGLLIDAPFSFLAVVILRRWKATPIDAEDHPRLPMSASEWTWKLGVLAVAYVVLYFTFGYFVAWRQPAVRAYYDAGSNLDSFFTQMQNVARNTPWLFPFQLLRGLCWAGIAVVIIGMLKGTRLEVTLAIAYTFAIVMNVQILLPNPYMPNSVRMAHFVETTSSNLIFGLFVGWLLTRRPKSADRFYQTVTTVFH